MNTLYYGDNLDILPRYIKDESVDLIYLDPPFNSNQDYNVLFAEQDGSRSAAQIKAFGDTWRWDVAAAKAYQGAVEQGGKVSETLQGFRRIVGDTDMLAYLSMMAPRLVELRRVLKPTGSIYLHCDPTASHYLKLVMDAAFGPANFRNEIIWKRTTAHSSAKRFGPIHDTLLYYGKSDRVIWNAQYMEYDDAYLEKYYRYDDGDGRLYWRNSLTAAGVRHGSSGKIWRDIDITATGQHWKFTVEKLEDLDSAGQIYWPPGGRGFPQIKRYRDELKGVAVGDIWTDIDRINQVAAERLGYPTQKPQALLERIVHASSNEGDIVLDPFCGCGTATAASQRLKRQWIGIDITHLAIGLIKHRLFDAFGLTQKKDYAVIGEPEDMESARQLAREEPYQFQSWALGKVDARQAGSIKRGADRGIDGQLYFHDEPKSTKQIIFSVKGGHTGPADVRDLIGVLDTEKAQIGVLISLQETTSDMRSAAASSGFYKAPWGKDYPRLQLLTVADLLSGKTVEFPRENVTFKKAPKSEPPKIVTKDLPF
jgi:site-specific DNA-methyltransferase (adenine-specific)